MSLLGEGSLGDYELGGFDASSAESVADAVANLLDNPHLGRSWLVRARPLELTSTDEVTVDLSTDGARVDYDDGAIQFPQSVITPYDVSYTLPGGTWGHATASIGRIILGDAAAHLRGDANAALLDAALTNFVAADWEGREVDIYLGPEGSSNPLLYGRVARFLSMEVHYDLTTISILVKDYSYVFEVQLQTNLYAGTGGAEGTSELEGTPKPRLIGKVAQLKPVQLDPATGTYQLNDGAVESVGGVEVGAKSLSFDADYADYTSLVAASLTSTEYATSLATGYVRIGNTNPDLKVTCTDVEGDNSSSYGYVSTIGPILRYLAVTRAGLTDPDDLDSVAFAALDLHTAVLGEFFTSPITILEVINVFHAAARSWSWLRPDKTLTCGRITAPEDTTPANLLYRDRDDLRMAPWKDEPYSRSTYLYRVGYGQYKAILDDNDFDATVTAATRRQWKLEWRYQKDDDATVLSKTPTALEETIQTVINGSADALSLATEQLGLFKVKRRLVTISPTIGLVKLGIGTEIELFDNRQAASPRNMTVLGFRNVSRGPSTNDEVVLSCLSGLTPSATLYDDYTARPSGAFESPTYGAPDVDLEAWHGRDQGPPDYREGGDYIADVINDVSPVDTTHARAAVTTDEKTVLATLTFDESLKADGGTLYWRGQFWRGDSSTDTLTFTVKENGLVRTIKTYTFGTDGTWVDRSFSVGAFVDGGVLTVDLSFYNASDPVSGIEVRITDLYIDFSGNVEVS